MVVQSLGREIRVGGTVVPGRVWIAPMTGVTDLAYRQIAAGLGAPYLATEMVACAQFAQGRPDVVRRAAIGEGLPLMVVQLVGREPRWIAEAARMAARSGAQIIDLNFGCPAKEVTGHLCGSALMRDLDLASSIIAAAVDAVDVPVTVKMRLGWDESTRNASELAVRAEAAGARALAVHARTRSQFYGGTADWAAVATIKDAVNIPVVINGDIVDPASAKAALETSRADGVMIGRGAIGRPWIAAVIEAALAGREVSEPGPETRLRVVVDHLNASVRQHGAVLGLRLFRKHLAAYVEGAPWSGSATERRTARARLCRLDTVGSVLDAISDLWTPPARRMAA